MVLVYLPTEIMVNFFGQLLVNISSTMVRIWLQNMVNEQVYGFLYFVLYLWIYLPVYIYVILIFLMIRSTQTCLSLPTEITNISLKEDNNPDPESPVAILYSMMQIFDV